jgi:hypothetical protein
MRGKGWKERSFDVLSRAEQIQTQTQLLAFIYLKKKQHQVRPITTESPWQLTILRPKAQRGDLAFNSGLCELVHDRIFPGKDCSSSNNLIRLKSHQDGDRPKAGALVCSLAACHCPRLRRILMLEHC